MKAVSDIKKTLEEQKPYLIEKYNIKAISIFGSYSRNDAREDSDIDILVDFNKSPGLEFVDLAEELEKILGAKVDLVSRNAIKAKYFERIKQDVVHV